MIIWYRIYNFTCPLCLSDTLKYCIEMAKDIINLSPRPDSQIVLVYLNLSAVTKFEGQQLKKHPERGPEIEVGVGKYYLYVGVGYIRHVFITQDIQKPTMTEHTTLKI